jgi:hypothetical protein
MRWSFGPQPCFTARPLARSSAVGRSIRMSRLMSGKPTGKRRIAATAPIAAKIAKAAQNAGFRVMSASRALRAAQESTKERGKARNDASGGNAGCR